MPSSGNSNARKYLTTQVQTASREQLVLMLFDGAIRFAQEAARHMQKKETEGASQRIIRVQDILLELMVSLDRKAGGEIATNLASIYGYLYMRLVEANAKMDMDCMEEVLKHLRDLRATWTEAVERYRQEQPQASMSPPMSGISLEG